MNSEITEISNGRYFVVSALPPFLPSNFTSAFVRQDCACRTAAAEASPDKHEPPLAKLRWCRATNRNPEKHRANPGFSTRLKLRRQSPPSTKAGGVSSLFKQQQSGGLRETRQN